MIAIVDCNSFYCSCERVFRPDLETRPVVVLSNNDGCIISRSDEAKKIGVGMAGPYFLAKPLIDKHNVTVFSSNYTLYGDMSRRVMDTLRALMGGGNEGEKKVEVYSVDEAFIDIGHIAGDQLHAFASQIKGIVEAWTGISVSVGVAPTKTLAKIANHMAKKNKRGTGCIKVLDTGQARERALRETRVDGIWGVGSAYAQKLLNCGITSAFELSNMPEDWAHSQMGGVVGVRLIKELRGIAAISMEDELINKNNIATTRMFGRPVTKLSDLQETVATYISRAAEKLRRQHSAAKVVSVFIVPREREYSADFTRGNACTTHTTLDSATSFTHELIKPAVKMVEALFEHGMAYKKAGVMLSGLVPDASIQGNLFAPAGQGINRSLMATLDNLNFGMEDDTVKFVSSGLKRNWKMRQELRSSRYSTRWDELRVVS